MDTRLADNHKLLLNLKYEEIRDHTRTGKLPCGKYIIGRVLSLCKSGVKGLSSISKDDACALVADEIRNDWIDKNVYPISAKSVVKRIREDYDKFLYLSRIERRPDAKYRSAAWHETARTFNAKMTNNAYDIRCTDPQYQKQLEVEFGVRMTEEDEGFYKDNCFGAYVSSCTRTVPRDWMKQKRRLAERSAAESAKRQKLDEAARHQAEINVLEMQSTIQQTEDDDHDQDFVAMEGPDNEQEMKDAFPQVKIRTGERTFNENVIRTIVTSLAKYKISQNDLLGLTMDIANNVFGQTWQISAHDAEDGDLTCVLPSRKTIMNYLEDASYLNLQFVANKLLEKGDTVVTVGLDDTTKAAGHRTMDIKTDHITIAGPSTKRETYTTGYAENTSHSGVDAAKTYEYKLDSLAVLAGVSRQDILEQIDFWITDRAADCSKMLAELEISENQTLKCCAHVILGIDHGIDKVLRETETRIGVDKLIDVSNILKSASSSILITGLVAIAKLLSPSHASHSISLYSEFVSWLEVNDTDHHAFKGFISNRFGRIAELAKLYLVKKEQILRFFESVVDENANRLVLAVYTFLTNDWFQCCIEMYCLMGEIVIFPLMDVIGIDGRGSGTEHSWSNVRSFFNQTMSRLDTYREDFGRMITGKAQLNSAVIAEILEVLNRQLSQMSYFEIDHDNSDFDEQKLRFAPITNMGCESSFAKLDNQIKSSGGMTSVTTHSIKRIVSVNGLLTDNSFTDLTERERREKWQWGRSSEQVKQVRQLQMEFLKTVRASKELGLQQRQKLKQKKTQRMQKRLDECKRHGGPVTETSIDLLKTLNEQQLIAEIGYIRVTVSPDIHHKRRIKTTDGRYKFQNFSVPELQASIKAVIKPEFKQGNDIEVLLKQALAGRR